MSFRRHVITGEKILFAPERALRPHAFTGAPVSTAPCPFCPGNESETPPEIARAGTDGVWLARVFPNKYPPVGGAEVIVESPDHDVQFDSIGHAGEVVRLYAERYRAHAPGAYPALFKNEGTEAGSSIPHVHSQLVPLPFTPQRIAREIEGFRGAAQCPLCEGLETLIDESEWFRWVAPHASWIPYQQWIVPKRHVPDMDGFDDRELADLGVLLRRAAGATSRVAQAYNWAFMNFPGTAKAHAYVDILPRMTTIAGLELGSGTFVGIVDPRAAAERLRS